MGAILSLIISKYSGEAAVCECSTIKVTDFLLAANEKLRYFTYHVPYRWTPITWYCICATNEFQPWPLIFCDVILMIKIWF